MPVVIDYSPVGAIAQLAGDDGRAEAAAESAKLDLQQQQERQGVQQLLGHVAASQAGNERLAAEDARYAPRTGTGSGQVFAGPDSALAGGTGVLPLGAGGNLSAGPANATFQQGGSFTDATGNSYRVTPQQRQQLTNLQASGVTDPDQLAAATKKILGVPDLQGVQNADGTTSYVNASQAVSANARQQSQQTQAQHYSDMQADRKQRLSQLNTQIQAAGDRFAKTTQDKQALGEMKGQELLARTAAENAETKYKNFVNSLPPGFDPTGTNANDPRAQTLGTLQQNLSAAQQAQEALLVKHYGALSAAGAFNQGQSSAGNSAAPDQSQSFTHTATGPNGEKLGWNGTAWVPAQ